MSKCYYTNSLRKARNKSTIPRGVEVEPVVSESLLVSSSSPGFDRDCSSLDPDILAGWFSNVCLGASTPASLRGNGVGWAARHHCSEQTADGVFVVVLVLGTAWYVEIDFNGMLQTETYKGTNILIFNSEPVIGGMDISPIQTASKKHRTTRQVIIAITREESLKAQIRLTAKFLVSSSNTHQVTPSVIASKAYMHPNDIELQGYGSSLLHAHTTLDIYPIFNMLNKYHLHRLPRWILNTLKPNFQHKPDSNPRANF